MHVQVWIPCMVPDQSLSGAGWSSLLFLSFPRNTGVLPPNPLPSQGILGCLLPPTPPPHPRDTCTGALPLPRSATGSSPLLPYPFPPRDTGVLAPTPFLVQYPLMWSLECIEFLNVVIFHRPILEIQMLCSYSVAGMEHAINTQ